MAPTATPCPYCGEVNDVHLHPDEPLDDPEPGNWSMCFFCGNASVYDASPFREGLTLRWPTVEEVQEMETDEELQTMKAVWREKARGRRIDPFDFADEVRKRAGS